MRHKGDRALVLYPHGIEGHGVVLSTQDQQVPGEREPTRVRR
jgi:hypothetical protein